MKEVEVVAAVIKNGDKILCMQRDEGKNKETSFKWEFPGGKVDEGETPREAIIREIQEELEMDIEIVREVGKFEHQYSDFLLHMTCFECTTNITDIKLNVHIDYKWLKTYELMSLDWCPADLPIAKSLHNGK